jgi:hypothetical protein
MVTSEIAGPGVRPSAAAASGPAQAEPDQAGHGLSFHDILSAMNPLQYLPGVGTIYRALTGDVIPEALRRAGSMVVSAILGGPIGLGINIATTLAEKATGIDPEKIVAAQIRATPAPVVARAETQVAAESEPFAVQAAWTPAQLEAYGVVSTPSGNMKLGEIEGADVLNAVQLLRLGTAVAAYSANQATHAVVKGG